MDLLARCVHDTSICFLGELSFFLIHMEQSLPMKVVKVGENFNIDIQVTPYYEYEVRLNGLIGNEDEEPIASFSMWGWINHLRGKNWWNWETEGQFIELATKLCK